MHRTGFAVFSGVVILLSLQSTAKGHNQPRGSRVQSQVCDCTLTVPMSVRRGDFPAAVRLNDGKVLISGGVGGGKDDVSTAVATAEIFDPLLESWSPTTNAMAEVRI